MAQVVGVAPNGIAALVDLLRVARQRGGDVQLVQPRPGVLEAFALLGFGRFFRVDEDLDGALRAPRPGGPTV
jgi:anti-anti-sigma regulatory factor